MLKLKAHLINLEMSNGEKGELSNRIVGLYENYTYTYTYTYLLI